MHAPTAVASSEEAARAVVAIAEEAAGKSNLLTCWLGRNAVEVARQRFDEAGIPTYETPGKAVRAFLHMVHYRRNQEMRIETPPSAPAEFAPVNATARRIVEGALSDGCNLLSEPESKELLAAYGVPVVETRIASSPEEVLGLADELGYPVALKGSCYDHLTWRTTRTRRILPILAASRPGLLGDFRSCRGWRLTWPITACVTNLSAVSGVGSKSA
jgi:acetyltransferase